MPQKRTSTFHIKRDEIFEFVQKTFREGNLRRIIIKDSKGKKYAEIPVTIGVIGFLVAPILVGILAMAAVVEVFEVELVHQK